MVSPAHIASGELLVQGPEVFEGFPGMHEKSLVVEMQTSGIFDACEKQRVPVLIVHGISDYGDTTKDNTFHKVASEAAAIDSKSVIASLPRAESGLDAHLAAQTAPATNRFGPRQDPGLTPGLKRIGQCWICASR